MEDFGRRILRLTVRDVSAIRTTQGVMIPEGTYHHVSDTDEGVWVYRKGF